MNNTMNIQYGSKICHLPKSLVNNEEFMKEIVSANVWNNKLKKSDKMNLLKYLPSFPQNDTHEKKETLKKLFLGKPINFENQIRKFVHSVREGEFSPAVKSQKVLDLLLAERRARILLLKRRMSDLQRIVDAKKKLGLGVSTEEEQCLAEFANKVFRDDPLDEIIDARFEKVMERVTVGGDTTKKSQLYCEYDDYVASGNTSLHAMSLDDVVNRCQNDTESDHDSAALVGIMTRKRRQLQNGFDASLNKYAKLKWERESSESQSDSSDDAKSNNNENSDESVTSDTDSVASNHQKHNRNNRHERREFRCPQDDFGDFFSLLQRLFVGAHQQRLTTGQIEERVRHWQIVNQRNICEEYNRWAGVSGDWVGMVVSALTFLSKVEGASVEYRPKQQLWRWKGPKHAGGLHQLYQEWRHKALVGPGGARSVARVAESGLSDHIPPALYATSWQMRSSTAEERHRFQAQERRRFSRPYRGFVYNVHGFCCVVSPIRGCLPGRDYSGVRARGHPLLIAERPPHVNIVEIVRDAVARLPNGQGSRADIVALAMDSAFWNEPHANEKNIGQCISSALDRLQGEGCDPSVKYNSRLKLWFYRHRNKSLAELEQMHLKNCQEEMRRSKSNGVGRALPPGGPLMTVSGLSVPPYSPMLVPALEPPHSSQYHTHQIGGPFAPPRPSYQQFSRAVTSARDNVIQHPFNVTRPHMFAAPAGALFPGNALMRQESPHDFYHQQHFYY